MLIHTVYFYLKPELTAAQQEEFRVEGLEALRAIPMEAYHVGRPAATERRPVIDASYSFAITCVFKDLEAHNVYQVHTLHQEFINRFKTYWSRVQIYDAE